MANTIFAPKQFVISIKKDLHNIKTPIGLHFDKLAHAVTNKKISTLEPLLSAIVPEFRTVNLIEAIEWLEKQPGISVSEGLKKYASDNFKLKKNIYPEIEEASTIKEDCLEPITSDSNKEICRIEYSEHTREVKIVNLVTKTTRTIRTLSQDSENYLVFSFLYKNPNKRYKAEELYKLVNNYSSGKKGESYSKMLGNIGFNGDLKKLFFPGTTKDSIMFVNPIYKNISEEVGISINGIQ